MPRPANLSTFDHFPPEPHFRRRPITKKKKKKKKKDRLFSKGRKPSKQKPSKMSLPVSCRHCEAKGEDGFREDFEGFSECETVDYFDAKLKENGVEMLDYFVRTLLTIIHAILLLKTKENKQNILRLY
ncbi:unnamed protein product [Fraxinus pennsylvanica]|uniref:Uncharacterized protein n=1 Tax=Fraxinus pennsylvanica TaxID=56036 RepID=A0AAD2DVA6_9LAMI|nr:unnamed protein product [Fraxinus pennsylvanica]